MNYGNTENNMITKYIKINSLQQAEDMLELEEAAKALKNGSLVAFPTETVYGLGANALDREAVRSIFAAKGRPSDNPLIVHIAEIDMLRLLVQKITPDVEKLTEAFWPGPLTLVMKKTPVVPDEITAGLDTVAVRMPDHPVALKLIEKSGVPVAAPSANRSGKPSPTLAKHVAEDMDGRISYIIDGGPCRVGLESTVLDMTVDPPSILRPGGITPEMVKDVAGAVRLDANLVKSTEKPKSPGMKYTHYAPAGDVYVVAGKQEEVSEWINRKMSQDRKSGFSCVVIAAAEHLKRYPAGSVISYGSICDPDEVASNIFRLFRDCDSNGTEKIYVESIPKEGIGLAVMNRIEKAAGGKIIQVG